MKKQLMVGLLSAGLLAAMLPGLAVAKDKDDGKSDCKKGGWTEFVREDQTAFVDQAECVAYVAEGGTLVLPPTDTFQSVCTSLGGTNAESYSDIYFNVSPACLWNGMSNDDFWAAKTSLTPYCSTLLQGVWQSWMDPDYLGCEVVPG